MRLEPREHPSLGRDPSGGNWPRRTPYGSLPDPTGARTDLKGNAVPDVTPEISQTWTDPSQLAWGPAITPYLIVDGAIAALDWYVDIFAAERRGQPYVMSDGSIAHAELGIGDAVLMIADGQRPAQPVGTAPSQSLFVTVPDSDATVARAVTAGAELERAVVDENYGRTGVIIDPFGHRWMVNTALAGATRFRPGDVSYLTIYVDDAERAKAFYAAVLGPGVEAGTTSPPISLWPVGDGTDGATQPGAVPVFRVSNINAAIGAVRAGGGEAATPVERPYGQLAGCVDPDGVSFAVWQAPRQ